MGVAGHVAEPENIQRLEAAKNLEANTFAWCYLARWGRKVGDTLVVPPQVGEVVTRADGTIVPGGTGPEEGEAVTIGFDVTGKRSTQTLKEWQMKCYERLVDAAKVQYEAKQQKLAQMRDDLLAELNLEDA